ncbi:MAG: DUF1624 domain-containing protein [Hyphomicrobiales bacterium]|nr:DUF1624 domain-containing protein [Hyphomicrobiales bacterium]MCP4998971.1 DUF1624 domain-containing protein [Hyphomicrobiales bacterium]
MTDLIAPTRDKQRLVLIDVARGIALLAMAVYHFTWDLEFFGYVERGLTTYGGWKIFARMIAGSFLFLVGISLVLGHGNAIRWRSFSIRLAMIVAAAALITGLTYYAMPDRFIFFGILHCIAVSSVLGLPFLRLPAAVSVVAGAAVLFAQPYLASSTFNSDALLWLGLSTVPVLSNDYVPIFPWFGPVLLGIGAAKTAQAAGVFPWLAAIYRGGNPLGEPVAFAGRHSLAFYLLHQPILIGLVYLVSLAYPAPTTNIVGDCNRTCSKDNPVEFCERFCQCTVDELIKANLLDDLPRSQSSGQPNPEIGEILNACTASAMEGNRAE